jgi:GT2 family glycosyltransferase
MWSLVYLLARLASATRMRVPMNSTTSPGYFEASGSRAATLSIVIVTWNVRDYVRDCLQSLVDTGVSKWAQVIVVDNTSSDDTESLVRTAYPWVHFIQSGANLGFSRGNNLGMRFASGEFILLLNPDTVVRQRAVDDMLEFAACHPDVGAVGCKQVDRQERTSYEAAVNFPTVWRVACDFFKFSKLFPTSKVFNRRLMGYWNHEDSREVPAIPGSAMLLRRSAIDQVGSLDNSMHYAEDMELCLRLRRGGWNVYYLSSAVIVHYGGESSRQDRNPGLRYQIAFQSFWYYLYKHFGMFAAFRLSCMMFFWSICTMSFATALQAITFGGSRAEQLREIKKIAFAMLRWSTCRKRAFRHHLADPITFARNTENG